MRKLASEILAEFKQQGLITALQGADRPLTNIVNVDQAGAEDLIFVSNPEFVAQALQAAPGGIVTSPELAPAFAELQATAILLSPDVRLAQALLRQAYVDRDLYHTEWPRVHPSAIIHASVAVPEDAVIGPHVVIGKDVKLGPRVVVMANSVIESGASLGADTVLHPSVVVGYDCEIGARCILKSGSVVGAEGFGFAQDNQRKSHRLPQLGKVIIGDDVVLGANCNVDRAAYDETVIENGCKLDALVHIAHGVHLGEDGIVCAQTAIAGSTLVGKRVICSGQTGILDHLSICDDVVLVQRAAAISDIKQPGIYAGQPLQPVKQFFKTSALSLRLGELRALVMKLKQELESLRKSG